MMNLLSGLHKIRNSERGFTVIEMLVAIILVGAVLAIATSMIVQSFNVFRSSTFRMSAGQMAELAQRQVALYLRSATDVDDIGCLTDDGNNGELTFTAYHPEDDRDSPEQVKIELSLEDGGLRIEVEDLDIDRQLAYSVQRFCIEKVDDRNDEFEISIVYYDQEDETYRRKGTTVRSRNISD